MAHCVRILLTVVVLSAVAACERPPVETEQLGYRGTGIQQVTNPRIERGAGTIPTALPPATTQGPRAGDVYQNVQVLGDLSVPQFTRLMQSITKWVAPEQGCNYCHVPGESLAADDIYTKVVSRRMLQMNLAVNASWSDHVGSTGVTCYTCHRGNNVPEYGWFSAADDDVPMVGNDGGQNKASAQVGVTSLPYDPFSAYLVGDAESIRVLGEQPLPSDASTASIQSTERSYALMIHLSSSLGVNCTYCHNSRAFGLWEESSQKRVTAWYGLQLVRSLNNEYLKSVQSVLPVKRLGVNGDVQKINCMTCHQGAAKPLDGAPMLADHPELTAAR